ncbi:MAG: helix-turn-helix domain-containing protein [Holophaga sp.]|nr:helix-turn-helix domain-containing protein [Holophaga sp.]
MKKNTSSPFVTPQQIKRFLHIMTWNSLSDAQATIEESLGRPVDTSNWAAWEKSGMRETELTSDDLPIAEFICRVVGQTLFLSPLQVRVWREELDLSQPDAAKFLGVARSTWSRWEQVGIEDHFAGSAAYALAASIASKDPKLVAERASSIVEIRRIGKSMGRKFSNQMQEAIHISGWGACATDFARLGIGSYGLYLLLRNAWDSNACPRCAAKNSTDAKFCSSCGSALEPEKEVTKP